MDHIALPLPKYGFAMKKYIILMVFSITHCFADDMTPEKMIDTIESMSKSVAVDQNVIEFEFQGTPLTCVFDVRANRMRIISPIVKVENISGEHLYYSMVANFHSALDARYSIANDIVYAAYLHPLSSLSEEDLRSAIRQVAQSVVTFGTTYSSGDMFFGGDKEEGEPSEDIEGDAI